MKYYPYSKSDNKGNNRIFKHTVEKRLLIDFITELLTKDQQSNLMWAAQNKCPWTSRCPGRSSLTFRVMTPCMSENYRNTNRSRNVQCTKKRKTCRKPCGKEKLGIHEPSWAAGEEGTDRRTEETTYDYWMRGKRGKPDLSSWVGGWGELDADNDSHSTSCVHILFKNLTHLVYVLHFAHAMPVCAHHKKRINWTVNGKCKTEVISHYVDNDWFLLL